jgi:hypothetical protein
LNAWLKPDDIALGTDRPPIDISDKPPAVATSKTGPPQASRQATKVNPAS